MEFTNGEWLYVDMETHGLGLALKVERREEVYPETHADDSDAESNLSSSTDESD